MPLLLGMRTTPSPRNFDLPLLLGIRHAPSPYRDFELLSGEVVLKPVVDLPLEVLVLLHLLDLLGLLLLVAHQVLLVIVLA
jgi:hypothetical protein